MDHDYLLQFFEYSHLPPAMQEISKQFHAIAYNVFQTIPSNPERSMALRKLLEAKDCAVRASIFR